MEDKVNSKGLENIVIHPHTDLNKILSENSFDSPVTAILALVLCIVGIVSLMVLVRNGAKEGGWEKTSTKISVLGTVLPLAVLFPLVAPNRSDAESVCFAAASGIVDEENKVAILKRYENFNRANCSFDLITLASLQKPDHERQALADILGKI